MCIQKSTDLFLLLGKKGLKKESCDMGLYDSTVVKRGRIWPAIALMAVFLSGAIAGDYWLYTGSEAPAHWKPTNEPLAALLERKANGAAVAQQKIAEAGEASAVSPPSAKPSPDSGMVDLNQAGLSELMSLPGIGEVKAKAILEYRDKVGLFQSVDELLQVKGIGEKSLEKLKDRLKVNTIAQ
jgi:comEA protein